MAADTGRRAAVITISDGCANGTRTDTSGDAAEAWLIQLGIRAVARQVVPDDAEAISAAVLDAAASAHLVVTTGGTGLGPRDVTPQTVGPLLDYPIPGIAEAMRSAGRRSTPHAMLSRQLAGVSGGALVLVLPGSTSGVIESLDAVAAALPHALDILAGATGHAEPQD